MMANTPSSLPAPGLYPYACTTCHKRKVKCDRKHSCSNCIKHHTECEFRAPPPPRKRKQAEDAVELVTMPGLQPFKTRTEPSAVSERSSEIASPDDVYAKILSGSPVADRVRSQDKTHAGRQSAGRLISKEGKSIYLDHNFWKVVGSELQDSESVLPENSNIPDQQRPEDEDLGLDAGSLLFPPVSKVNLAGLHPNPVHIFKLWQVFLENVNPLTKIIHAPTLQQRILDASGDLGSVPEDLEALMFAIYCAALTSLDDSEVQRNFGEARTKLLAVHRQGAQKALVNAGLLKTSNMTVLQAFVIFIISARLVYDPHTLWSLSGIGVRIAQRIGLHRDGSCLGLSVFETELRRRLWWQLTVVDTIIGKKTGSNSSLRPAADTRVPLNVNDSDLDPEMKESPADASRPTEMVFCLMRYEFGQWLDRQSKSKPVAFGDPWDGISGASIPAQEKEDMIKELEHLLEDKYVRFCDPSIPLHLMTTIVARSIGVNLRLIALHPRLYDERGERPTQTEKDLLFDTCLSVADYSNILETTSKTRKYLWHVDYHFPWDMVLYMLSELRHRPLGDRTAKAWRLIDFICTRQYQQLGSRAKNPLHLAIANLGIKAWVAHVAECERRRTTSLPQPNIISVFWRLTQHGGSSSAGPVQMTPSSGPVQGSATGTTAPAETVFGSYPHNAGDTFSQPAPVEEGIDFSALSQMYPVDDSPIDWGLWDELLQEYQQQQQQFSGGNVLGAA